MHTEASLDPVSSESTSCFHVSREEALGELPNLTPSICCQCQPLAHATTPPCAFQRVIRRPVSGAGGRRVERVTRGSTRIWPEPRNLSRDTWHVCFKAQAQMTINSFVISGLTVNPRRNVNMTLCLLLLFQQSNIHVCFCSGHFTNSWNSNKNSSVLHFFQHSLSFGNSSFSFMLTWNTEKPLCETQRKHSEPRLFLNKTINE